MSIIVKHGVHEDNFQKGAYMDATTRLTEDRIIELKRVRAKELIPHPLNWRMHPKEQMELLKHSIKRFGVATALLGYYSERNKGQLTILDGHGRVELNQEQVWPVLVLDLTDEEADTLLLLIDPISGLALPDPRNVLTLASKADVVDPVLADFCMQLAENALSSGKQPKQNTWPTIRFAVPPDMYQLWLEIVGLHEGDQQEAFGMLLGAAGPLNMDDNVQSISFDDVDA